MASLRRALSIQSVQNGSPFGVPSAAGYASTNVSPVPSPTAVNSSGNALSPADAYFPKAGGLALSSVLRGLWYRVSKLGSLEKSKVKATLLRRPLYLLAICFFIGLLCGLTPLSWYEAERDFRLDVNNFPTELEQPGRPLEGTIPGVTPVTGGSSGVGQHRPSKVKSVLTTPRKLLLIITPTYNRPLQAHYLTRLAHTLKLVPPPILWLVVEGQSQSPETAELLRKTGIMYRHLVCNVTLANIKDRGTHERNTALAHIEHHQLDGIVYFADDDNMYTLELFSQLREIKRFGVWPVGMLTPGKSKTILEGPVCDGHEVIGWHTNEKSKKLRRFHVDMSGFGFNSTILWDPQRWGKLSVEPTRQLDSVKEGMQETTFIEQLVEDESQMEGLPSGCSKVMVWHLHFEAPGLPYPSGWTLDEPLKPVVPLH